MCSGSSVPSVGEMKGGVVHILRAAVHLFQRATLNFWVPPSVVPQAVNAQQAAGHGEVFGLAAPDAVEHDVQRPVGPMAVAYLAVSIGNAIE